MLFFQVILRNGNKVILVNGALEDEFGKYFKSLEN